ncbi:MAG: hypothetical protein RR385_09325 [Clostridiales bacterium]
MKLKFKLLKETKTCYRFECWDDDNFITLYLKKTAVEAKGINPDNGIIVEIIDIKGDTEND